MDQIVEKCPICNTEATRYAIDLNGVFYVCPVCGRFFLTNPHLFANDGSVILNPHSASYLFYNAFSDESPSNDCRYHSTLSKELCDEYSNEYKSGNILHGQPVHMDNGMIDAWYPKSFSERIDRILLYLGTHTKHIGQPVVLSYEAIISWLFIDRIESDIQDAVDSHGRIQRRDHSLCYDEVQFMLGYLKSNDYVDYRSTSRQGDEFALTLNPKGLNRVDELQKNTGQGRAAFVAMKFGPETETLRKAIREGIQNADYTAVFIDEVEHNEFITPEILKHIRDSKFVVVDLSHENPGAYLEEGYAMGLGKPVIQLCKDGVRLHFDIAQKNTIIWNTEDEIPERLANRIKATID